MSEEKEKRPAITVPSKVTSIRHKCPDCGDKLFKIKDGVIKCRNSHVIGKWITNKPKSIQQQKAEAELKAQDEKAEKKEEPVPGKLNVTEEHDVPASDPKPENVKVKAVVNEEKKPDASKHVS